MITVEQIKAGRALLEWNQNELAKYSGVSKDAINKIERRIVMPRAESLQKIGKAMEGGGVEFIEGPGVRLRADTLQVRVFEGKDAVFRLFDDINKTLKPGQVMFCNGVDERYFIAAGETKFKEYLKIWKENNIGSRVLSLHGDNFFVDYREHYRWVPAERFSQVPHFIYENKYAIILWKPIQRILVIENRAITDSFRKQFEATWKKAAVPPAYIKSSYKPQE